VPTKKPQASDVGQEVAPAPILVGLGANLPSPAHGPPRATLQTALAHLERRGLRLGRRSRWYESAPVPVADQPWFVNGVVEIFTALGAPPLLELLHAVERDFGRFRGALNAPRTLDLDLIAYGDVVRDREPPILPHPRMAERAFVLLPLREVAPDWRHPVSGLSVEEMIRALPPGQTIRLAGEG